MIVAIANELGGLCRAKGDFDRTKRLYKRVLDVLDQARQDNTENDADMYMGTNEMFSALGF